MTAINPVTDLSRDADIAVVTVDSPPVNAIGAQVRAGLVAAIAQAGASDAKAVVLICAGRTFFAGADITEFGKPTASGPGFPDLMRALEDCPRPVVAAIHGTALGGGLETALAAHYRVAAPSAKLGLPEVTLGILPGAGGTQRLPRVVGVPKALEMIAGGRPISATEALAAGLVDELVEEGKLRDGALAFARRLVAEGKAPVRVRDNDARLGEARASPQVFADFRAANARKFRGFLAPEQAIRAIEAAVNAKSFDEGLMEERRLFMELAMGPQAPAQQYYFFAERQAQKIPDVPDDTPARPIRKVGVVGAGTMGGGIAMTFANAGLPVTIVEQQREALDRGLAVIRRNYERTATRGGITTQEVERRCALITGSLDLGDLADADLVIEAVFERMDVKMEVFRKLDAICRPGAVLATNTSFLDVDQIAAVTGRPQDVLGLHFFSPANVMKLLEVVRGEKTARDVIATAMRLARTIGKIAVLARVGFGFIGNRMLFQRQREAGRLILEGALPWDVDRVLTDFGLPMGPFAMDDLAGLDLGWVRAESHGQTIRDVLCEMDRRGQKTGAGYYDYDENRKAVPSPVTEKIVRDFVARSGVAPRRIADEEILWRCLHPMINEGVRILEEGKAIRPSDIDVVWVNGYGWPVYRGGPMYYGDQIGAAEVLARMRELEKVEGVAARPAALLEKLAAEGGKIADIKTS